MPAAEYDASGFEANRVLAVTTYVVGTGTPDEARAAVEELAAEWVERAIPDDDAVRFLRAASAERAG